MTAPSTTARAPFRVTVLYADRLNLYADRGNLIVLARRCERRGIPIEITRVGIGDPLPSAGTDLLYLGGGQDRDQRRCAGDLARHRDTIEALVDSGTTVLGICGGYQLLGHRYATPDGTIAGLGLLDIETVREEGARLVGNAVIDPGDGRRLVGFENHQGRTVLGAMSRPLGAVLVGHGNNGSDRTEGAVSGYWPLADRLADTAPTHRSGVVIGTYLHGPLLAKNAWLADELLTRAVGAPHAELDDRFACAAHRRALDVALSPR